MQVVGTNPNIPDEQRIAKLFPPGALPKLQSFKAAKNTDKTKLLIVGGRYMYNAHHTLHANFHAHTCIYLSSIDVR